MAQIDNIDALEALYGPAAQGSIKKVTKRITPLYRQWIEAARFVVLTTAGPEGTDGSPRGDDGMVVQIADDGTLLLPDWRGNNRLDSIRNIVRDGRASLMFMVPGELNVVRVNGSATLHDDADLCAQFEKAGKTPRTVIKITPDELYFQCAKAIMRSKLWEGGDDALKLPTAGQFLKEQMAEFDADTYDRDYPVTAIPKMW